MTRKLAAGGGENSLGSWVRYPRDSPYTASHIFPRSPASGFDGCGEYSACIGILITVRAFTTSTNYPEIVDEMLEWYFIGER